MPTKPFTLLLVDDNPADVQLMHAAICKWKSPCDVHTVADGERALDFLYQRDQYRDAPRPDLIFLDLITPRLDGFDVLRTVKQDPERIAIPIIVFAADRLPSQIQEAYDLRANAYVVKPRTLEEYLRVLDATGQYWLNIASLPPSGE